MRVAPRPRYNPYFDGIVKREYKLRFADRLKNTLLNEPDWIALADHVQAKRGDYLGKLRVSHFVRNFPQVFEFTHDQHKYKWLRFTTPARELFVEHMRYKRKEHRLHVAEAVTKLLMMSKERMLETKQIARLGKYLGFPQNFQASIFLRYPQYFKPVNENGTRMIKLTCWHKDLAVTAREKWIKEAGISNPYAFPQPGYPEAGDEMPEDVKAYFDSMQTIPFSSPYEDFRDVVLDSPSGLKRALATYHEILSLTIEKRVLLRSFNNLNEDFGLPEHSLEFARQHQPLFYISHAGERPWVFLREAYDGSKLREKHPLRQFKDRFFALCMSVELEKFDQQEIRGSFQYDTEDSDVEFDDKPFRFTRAPIDEYDVDGWCMN